jgi:hypothetical protein
LYHAGEEKEFHLILNALNGAIYAENKRSTDDYKMFSKD